MRIAAICRGAPGLGRVVPSVAITQTLSQLAAVDVGFASYGPGSRYLAARNFQIADIGVPDGLFIEAVAPQAIAALNFVESFRPDLILIDGEFYLPLTMAHLAIPIVYLANPHDLIGPPNTFRRVNQLLLTHASAVIISSLSCPRPMRRADLVSGVPCLEVPAITKDIPAGRQAVGGPPRVLLSTGGGSARSDELRRATDVATEAVLDTLALFVAEGAISHVSLVLGADARAGSRWRRAPWLTVIPGPVELTDLYRIHELLITRAGRNTIAEAAYCGIPAVLLPIIDDPYRSSEQAGNADAVSHLPAMFPLGDWRVPDRLRQTVSQAILAANTGERAAGQRGNEPAAAFITDLLNRHPQSPKPLPAASAS